VALAAGADLLGGDGVAAMVGGLGAGEAAVAGESGDQCGELLGGGRGEDSDGFAADSAADKARVCGEDFVAGVWAVVGGGGAG